jgi:UDP-3-O-[3-hydroxymyristoyl] glucosamine N-acyltransferase
VTRPGAYGGYPLQRLPDALKTAVNTTRLAKLRRDLRKVMKHLGITSEDLET